jgi:hypothetical protein
MEYEQARRWLFGWLPQEMALKRIMASSITKVAMESEPVWVPTVLPSSPLPLPAGPDYFPEHVWMETATVRANDLRYVLAHIADEIHGHPDREHWVLPGLQAALRRLERAANPAQLVTIEGDDRGEDRQDRA